MFLLLVPQGVAHGAPGADCVTDVHQQSSELANQNPRSTNGSNDFEFHREPAHRLLPTSGTSLSAWHREVCTQPGTFRDHPRLHPCDQTDTRLNPTSRASLGHRVQDSPP